MTLRVVLATHNPHKVREFQAILGKDVTDLAIEAYDGPEPIEDGTSFAENALIKARTAAEHTGLIAMADDSGISVDVLGGSPGIFSAGWSGSRDDEANRRLLLKQIEDMAPRHRGARFTCAIAVVVPVEDGSFREHVVHGLWPGRVATAEAGDGGFGYDPVFVPDGYSVTSAELTAEEKNASSHRAQAFAAVAPYLGSLSSRE